MGLLTVDKEKCTRCGCCADVCPTRIIDVDSEGPHVTGNRCIACGHCVAVCPTAALDNMKAPLAGQTPAGQLPVLDADTAARFLRSRRSVRSYKKDPVPRGKILQLLDIARLAPTGSNSQGVPRAAISLYLIFSISRKAWCLPADLWSVTRDIFISAWSTEIRCT